MSRQSICHEWASSHKPNGKSGNIFYADGTIYSYGRHFPIARKMRVSRGDHSTIVCLLNSSSYSTTTACHQSAVRRSMPSSWLAFEVPIVDFDFAAKSGHSVKHRQNWKHLVGEFQARLRKATKSRSYIESSWSYAESARQSANQYRQLFCPNYGKDLVAIDLETAKAQFKLETAKELAKRKRIEARRARQLEARRAELIDQLAKWRSGKLVETMAGFSTSGLPIALRIKPGSKLGDIALQSSWGAEMSLRAFRHALPYAVWLRQLAAGLKPTIDRKVNDYLPLAVGQWSIDAIDGRTITLGCHIIEWQAIDQLLDQLRNMGVSISAPAQEPPTRVELETANQSS